MRTHQKTIPGREMERVAMPLFWGQDDLLASAMHDARALFIR
jgi:hypothetical protein